MKRIAILVETALASGRSILAGISQYVHERDDWSVFHPTGYLGATEPDGLEQWDGDGIIARISGTRVLESVRLKNVPVVDVLGNVPACPYPIIKSDDRAIGRMAGEHFIESGHHHFAFLGLEDERWSLEREEAFLETVRPRARRRSSFHLNADEKRAGHWNENVNHILEWLERLPRPLALMVASDQFGPITMKACQRLGVMVPEEVSIVGVDNDQPFCNLCRPRLSSIEPDHVKVGYEAARLLDRMISGEETGIRQIETAPLTLQRRPSSDATAVNDPALVKALQFIRESACLGISVDDVARNAGLSRSVLQRRFQEHLGRTVGDSLLAMKLRRARDMLSFTELPLAEVAERSGFNYQEYLTYVFKKHLDTTPARYRATTRALA
ncbi:MAG: substrate-binding domain-containing protein [Puniceicoccaceae bacterium]